MRIRQRAVWTIGRVNSGASCWKITSLFEIPRETSANLSITGRSCRFSNQPSCGNGRPVRRATSSPGSLVCDRRLPTATLPCLAFCKSGLISGPARFSATPRNQLTMV